MFKKFCLLIAMVICSFALRAQNCSSLGCAGTYTITTDGSLADQASGPEWGCYNGYPRKQTIWQYFYSPSGGNYTQSFSSPADLDWLVYDMGTSFSSLNCPVDPSVWTQVGCDLSYDPGGPTGPGEESTVSTVAGHYYAVALILWEPLTITFTFGTPQLGGSNLTAANCLVVLPVKLISFTALHEANNVVLTWKVADEINISRYDIQWSLDGLHFQLAGTVTAGQRPNYSFVHVSPATGKVYYRLKMVDNDGKASFSGVLAIQNANSTQKGLQVINNPVANNLYLTGLKTRGEISVIDMAGKTIVKMLVQSQALSTDVSTLRPGLYVVRYSDGINTEFLKFLKL